MRDFPDAPFAVNDGKTVIHNDGTRGQIGHNSDQPRWTEDRDAQFGRAIESYVGDARIEEALLRDQLLKLDSGPRLVALRNTILLGMVRYTRRNERADCTLAVYNLVVWLSDNDRGFCWLSQRRFGEILNRTTQRVSQALDRLCSDGLIGRERGDGENNCYWPIMPAMLHEAPAGIMWFVNRLSAQSNQRRAEAIPFKASASETPHVKRVETPNVHGKGFSETPNVDKRKPPTFTATYTPKENLLNVEEEIHRESARTRICVVNGPARTGSDKRTDGLGRTSISPRPENQNNKSEGGQVATASEVVSGFQPSKEQADAFCQIANDFGRRPSLFDVTVDIPVTRDHTDAELRKLLKPHKRVDYEVLDRALESALAIVSNKIAGDAVETDPQKIGKFGRYAAYFKRVLDSEVNRIKLADHEMSTKAALTTEAAKIEVATAAKIADKRLVAFDRAADENAERRKALPLPERVKPASGQPRGSSEVFEIEGGVARFLPSYKFGSLPGYYGSGGITGEHGNQMLDDLRDKCRGIPAFAGLEGSRDIINLAQRQFLRLSEMPKEESISRIIERWSRLSYREVVGTAWKSRDVLKYELDKADTRLWQAQRFIAPGEEPRAKELEELERLKAECERALRDFDDRMKAA